MGNAGSNMPRERHKSTSADVTPGSPGIKDGQAFVFEKKSHPLPPDEDEPPYYTKTVKSADPEFVTEFRPRATSAVDGQVEDEFEEDPDKARKSALPTVFKWDGGGRQVYISGTFSDWQTVPMVRSHGDFVTIIDLPEGEHQYKFLVDGEWKHDPKLKNIDNDVGNKNNLVSVRESDFEVFQALAKDSEEGGNNEQKEYTQEIPTNKPWEKVTGPPILPPHLLQVILNKDTPLSCEPTLLPEPNHVMLNHLYALSIKDGVMVLSATHRYRKKYVTTLLYKPI
uniref:5'-AMP-activated protein kinase subunit beta-1 n=1 Tax=Nyssomyia neivai TaxID=330878 RepID=A0A1L8E208_9DIPT